MASSGSPWHLHVGLVPGGPGVLALGVHWHDTAAHLLPQAVCDVAAHAVTTRFDEDSGEHQSDLLVVSYCSCPRTRAVQILSDTAVDLVRVLAEPLAVGPTAPFAPPGASS
jgi:predicted dehydrogenase